MNIFSHYRKLLFFAFYRFKGRYQELREYLASVLISEIEEFITLDENSKVLDVGGAKGEFCKILNEQLGCKTINLDPNPKDHVWPDTFVGYADNIPFKDNEFDLVICRGVLEHVPTEKQQQSVNEIYRVTKIGGISYIMIPPWFNPHAGHPRLKPFHVFPFKIAKFLRRLVFRNKIEGKSLADLGLYPITFRKMAKMLKASKFKVLATKDTHLRLHFITRIPLVREVMVPAVSFISTRE